jgi:hypothetical protein
MLVSQLRRRLAAKARTRLTDISILGVVHPQLSPRIRFGLQPTDGEEGLGSARKYQKMEDTSMKKSLFGHSLTLAAVIAFSISASAQQGRPAGVGAGLGGGAGLGVGNGAGANLGANAGLDGNANVGRAGAGLNGSSHVNLASQAPDSVLSNTRLDTSLTAALGKSGVTIPGGKLQTACSGFKNLGQCVAAMHVSQNLNIPFADLRSRMTGSGAVSLGKAIHETAGADINAKAEAKRASKQAQADIQATESVSTTASAS